MSKSLENYIGVKEAAEVMFKKVMEVPDDLILHYFELTTDEHPDRIEEIKKQLEDGVNPRDIKLQLAHIITQLYHGEESARAAREYFDTAFRKKEIPNQVPELVLEEDKDILEDAISQFISIGLVQSKSEFIRLVKQGGVYLEGEKLQLEDLKRVLIHGDVMRIGKKRFVKFVK
jgi:tyrosyl-tRNA synthetase